MSNPKFPGRPFEEGEELVKADELFKYINEPLKIIEGAVCLVGSTAEFGEGHDYDLLFKTDRLIENIEFGVSRQLPSELREKIHYLEGGVSGPFTSFYELYDLVLVPSERREKHQFSSNLKVMKKTFIDGVFEYSMGAEGKVHGYAISDDEYAVGDVLEVIPSV